MLERTIRSLQFATVLAIAALFCSFSSPAISSPATNTEQWNWSGVERLVVLPDIHGAYSEFTELLKASGVVNESLQWIAGTTHLVSLGDLLDRGAESRKVMDVLMRLQEEALAAGGHVHVVAGNHEIMNLLGDLRYVSAQEFAAFTDLESAEQRQQAYREFSGLRSEAVALAFLSGGPGAAERDPKNQQKFAELYPPGYFGHRSAFAPEGLYGSWLLSLPVLIVINRTVFVHGGLPAVTATAPIEKLNQQYRNDLRRFFELWRQLIDAGILTQDSILTNRTLAREALRIADPSSCLPQQRVECRRERGRATDEQRSPSPKMLATLRELIDLERSPMFGPSGPLWYRGSIRCKNILEAPVLGAALDNLGAVRVVVGHTPTTDRRVHRIRDDRLIMLDTGMLVSRYKGRPAALLIEGDTLEVQYLNPTERDRPLSGGGNGPYPLSNTELREALRHANVLEVKKEWFKSSSQIKLDYNGLVLQAAFFPEDKRGSGKREVAAYQLDELLGFDLVPITVTREVNGQAGVIQLAYANFLTESKRLREGIEGPSWCPLQAQQQLLEVYDYLIGNKGRSSTSMGYVPPLWNLQASEHGNAFTSRPALPDSATDRNFDLPTTVRQSLLLLDEKNVSEAVGQQLNGEQIAALLARRDALLTIIRHPEASYDQ